MFKTTSKETVFKFSEEAVAAFLAKNWLNVVKKLEGGCL